MEHWPAVYDMFVVFCVVVRWCRGPYDHVLACHEQSYVIVSKIGTTASAVNLKDQFENAGDLMFATTVHDHVRVMRHVAEAWQMPFYKRFVPCACDIQALLDIRYCNVL